jgi:hypothetical protein
MPENTAATASTEQGTAATADGAASAAQQQTEAVHRPESVSVEAWDALGDPGKRAIVAERARVTELEQAVAAANAKVTEFERAKLSDIERAQTEAQEARAALEKVTREGMVARVALEKGLKPSLVKYLTGGTKAEIAASADDLMAEIAANSSAGPRADLSQAAGRDGAAASGPEADFARFLGAELNR